jgi:hypothetical protein
VEWFAPCEYVRASAGAAQDWWTQCDADCGADTRRGTCRIAPIKKWLVSRALTEDGGIASLAP